MDKPILPPELQALSAANRHAEQKQKTNNEELGQSQFLELMITQLQNQDPMKPMESGEFLGQMAQFSTVNGIAELQKSVTAMTEALQSSQALQASTLVGRFAVMESSTLTTTGTGDVAGFAELRQAAGNVRVQIQSPAGQPVRELTLGQQPAGMLRFSWDGTDAAGTALPLGNYQFVVEAQVDGATERLGTFAEQRIESVTLNRDGGEPTLNLSNREQTTLAQVREIR